jgi:uncharacterized lipoprotein NlpE involved in copper resistance
METREKIFLLSLSFGLGISKLLLALTTAIFVYPTVSGKVIELGYSETWAILTGVIASVIIALSIDGLAGLFYPDGLTGLIAKRKGRFLYIAITVIGLALYAASGTFSIWMAPMVSDIVVSEPKDSFLTLSATYGQMYDGSLQILDKQVNKYEAELNEVKAKADLSYLADHPNQNVKKQLLAYINSGVNTWASDNIAGFKTKVRRARRAVQKEIDAAQKKYDFAVSERSKYIASAGQQTRETQGKLLENSTALRTEYIDEKAQAENVVIWIDIIMLFIIVFANPIRIYYAKINGEELPTSRSIAYAFYRVGVAFTNRFASAIYWLESKINFDINQDGVTGKPKETTPDQSTILSPIRHATQFDGVELQRRLEVEVGAIRNDLEKDLEQLRRENLELKQAKKSKPKKSKSTSNAFSLKEITVDFSKLPPIEKAKGFHGLEPKSQTELSKFRISIIEKKKTLIHLDKDARNAFRALSKSGTKETLKKNNVKLSWIMTVLNNHNLNARIKNGSYTLK